MKNKRLEGEVNLSKKLDKLDFGLDTKSIQDFDDLLIKEHKSTKRKYGLWVLSFLALLASSAYFLLDLNKERLTEDNLNIELEDSASKTRTIEKNNTSVKTKETDSLSEYQNYKIIEESSISKLEEDLIEYSRVTKVVKQDYKGEQASTEVINTSQINTRNKFSILKNENILRSRKIDKITKTIINKGIINSVSRLIEKKSKLLESIIPKSLSVSDRGLKKLEVADELINIQKWSPRISYGFSYHKIYPIAAAHETPFVSNHPTNIESILSYGYGIFGIMELNARSSIRPSFNFFRIGHRQNVEELMFSMNLDRLIMNLYSNELRFGLDYKIDMLPQNLNYDMHLGVGLAYHNTISLESNNYFEVESTQIKNANELTSDAFSYKVFLGLERKIYKNK